MDDFFSFISKAVIVIPIAVVIISLFLKFGQPKTGLTLPAGRQVNQTPTMIIPSKIPIAQIKQNNSFKFDLIGPIVCNNLFIKDKKVFYKNNQDNYLLNGDCLYQWQTGKFSGEKKCGLSVYINLAKSYSGLLNINDLVNNSMVASLTKIRALMSLMF
ncbi:hypothetical protein D4R99_04580 [bacterium]|nr:MAG: hypothetical protein D4R99_04580 [bacterium]